MWSDASWDETGSTWLDRTIILWHCHANIAIYIISSCPLAAADKFHSVYIDWKMVMTQLKLNAWNNDYSWWNTILTHKRISLKGFSFRIFWAKYHVKKAIPLYSTLYFLVLLRKIWIQSCILLCCYAFFFFFFALLSQQGNGLLRTAVLRRGWMGWRWCY